MTRPVRPSRGGTGDPLGTGLIGSIAAPAVALVGLLIVALVTLNLVNGRLPFTTGSGGGTGNGGPSRTAAPSNIVIPEPEADFVGSIVYAKAGNVWIQTDEGARQLTSSGHDSMPSWGPDGEWIYYIETELARGYWPVRGRAGWYDMEVPHLKRVKADGSGKPEEIESGRFKSGRYTWFSWMRQPVVSPNGKTIALVSDQPNPEERDVILQLYNLETGRFSRPDVSVTSPLGHQDPAWRPDGRILLFVRNGREGTRGAPVIYRYDTRDKKSSVLTSAGYLEPSYSPDGKYVAATRTSTIGTDVVILDGSRGTELLRVTTDGRSWAPVWSPAGDSIAFLNIEGQSVDLHLARLTGSAGQWTVEERIALTDVSGLDAASRPDWFIAPDQLPAASPASSSPTTSPSQ